MIQIAIANNTRYNTDDLSIELKGYFNQIAMTENLREQLVQQIYIITDIQKAINNNTITKMLDHYLIKYNKSIENINSTIISKSNKISYFNVDSEKNNFNKKDFTQKLAQKCEEVEKVFDQVARLNQEAINNAKEYIDISNPATNNITINNILLNNKKLIQFWI